MRRFFTCCGVFLLSTALTSASAQFKSAAAPTTKAPLTLVGGGAPGGFLAGADDCSLAHRAVASGDQFGVPFTTGTTGTAGQSEGLCYFFGQTGIDNDVWFDWTATATAQGRVSTCLGTFVDTKIAIWPGQPGCPVDGTSIVCNDDACGFQTTVTWPVTAGTSYTIQLGTFPGASTGSGTFDVTQLPVPVCGIYDDGTTENQLGLVAGGETGWLQGQDCLSRIDGVQTAYGGLTGVAPPNGTPSRIAVYEDSDCDNNPTTGPPVLLFSADTVTTNVNTDLFSSTPTGGVVIASSCSWVMATANNTPGQFPAPMDESSPTPFAWVMGDTSGPGAVNLADLNANNVPPLQMSSIGFPTAWLLRPYLGDSPPPFTPVCFGDQGCPCGNDSNSGGGCSSSLGTGAQLSASGVPSVSNDSLTLFASSTPNNLGLFFQGATTLAPPVAFGDGLRCCGDGVVRIGTYLVTTNGTNTLDGDLAGGFGPPITTLPGNAISAGDVLCYQWWYRDVAGPCSMRFNLSNAVEVTWQP